MKTSLFNYSLPPECIAQSPVSPRDASRLLVYNRSSQKINHDHFYNLKKYLSPEDVLVFNNTKVFPARLILNKPVLRPVQQVQGRPEELNGRQAQGTSGGGKVEIFLLQDLGHGHWECLAKNLGSSSELFLGCQKICDILKDKNKVVAKFSLNKKDFEKFLDQNGQTPTPPYIKTKDSKLIRQKYQTIYASHKGSVAAPTAGLHFTKRIFKELNKLGVQQEFVTLHVGLGTFAPIKSKKIEDHKLHTEYAILDSATCHRLNTAKQEGRRIIAVGTTSLRVLESLSNKSGKLKSFKGEINLFIYPSYKFEFVNSLITNFHLPQSSLLMLVAALVGRKKILQLYKLAVQKKYRFYSFGDAMLII